MLSPEASVPLASLERWYTGGASAPVNDDPLGSNVPEKRSPFPFDPVIAAKIVLWQGNLVRLEADAIVNSTNESLSDRSGLCGDIFRCAGPELAVEVAKLEGCRTGESKATKGYSLPARFVIHTVGPRYNVKYKTAAENALHSCYRSCLQVAVENELHSVGFCVVNSIKRGYPREDGAHIALRTVRRFLDRFGQGIETVVFTVENESDYDIYSRVLRLYFPRSYQEEEEATRLLPEDLGNEMGETVIEERKIRIGAFPSTAEEEEVERPPLASVVTIEESDIRGFATAMEGDPDQRRIQAQSRKTPKQLEDEETDRLYSHSLRRIQSEDLSDIARRNIIFQSGNDSAGRPIFVLAGMNMPLYTDEVALERVLLYSIKLLDPIATRREFVFVYLHANTPTERQPEMAWMRKLYRIWNRKYTHHMVQMFLVHPTFWFKVALGIMKPFLEDEFVDKLRYIDRLTELFEFIDHEQLKIPEDVYRYDHIENGIPYRPEENPGNEGL